MSDIGAFPEIYDSQAQTTSAGASYQPGAVFVHRSGTGRAQFALLKYVKLDNNGCSQGEALVMDDGQTVEYGVKTCTTGHGRLPQFRGIAMATIASNAFGFMCINGYCEKVDVSQTVASGEMLCMSGSTAAKLTPRQASSILNATLGTSTFATGVFPCAIARGAFATGVGSAQIIGLWG